MLDFKGAFKAIGAAVALGAMLPFGAAQAADSVKVGYMKIPPLVAVIHALESGIFAENDLDVDLNVLNGGPELMSALASGSVEIGQTSVGAVLIARAKGLPLKAFGTGDYEATGDIRNWLVGSEEAGTTTLADLEGKTLGVVAKASPAELMFRDHMLSAGVDASKVNFVALPFPQLPAALEVGNVDAIMVGEPFHTIIMNSDKITPAVLAEGMTKDVDEGKRIALGGYYAQDAWLADEANQDKARRFLRSLMRSNRELIADRSLVDAILQKDFGMPADVAARTPWPANTDTFLVNPDDYQPIIEAYVRTGMLQESYSASEAVITLEYE